MVDSDLQLLLNIFSEFFDFSRRSRNPTGDISAVVALRAAVNLSLDLFNLQMSSSKRQETTNSSQERQVSSIELFCTFFLLGFSYELELNSSEGSARSQIPRNFENPPASKNITLVRAERESPWNYDRYDRRHRSTNVLTFKVRRTCFTNRLLKSSS